MTARENSRIVQKKDTPKRMMKKLESEYGNEEMKNIILRMPKATLLSMSETS